MRPDPLKKSILRRGLIAALLIAAMLAAYPFVINRFAFHPNRQDLIPADKLPAGVQELFIPTSDGQRLHCYWLPRADSRRILLYFHGNAGNIGQRLPQLEILADLGISVLGVDYRGFGKSTGRPTEKGIYADGRAVLNYAGEELGYKAVQIIVLGRSIGTSVALEIAKDAALGGVILVSPLTTGRAVARANGFGLLAYFAGDRFNNVEKIKHLSAPLLILHGTEDDVVPFSMGKKIYALAPEPKRFAAIPGGGHNDIGWRGHTRYWRAIADFLQKH